MSSKGPSYASEPLYRFVAAWENDFRLLHLSMRGIRVLTGMPDVLETLMDMSEGEKKEKLSSDVAEARTEAELAQSEAAKGFPLLHAHTLIGLWAALETAIEDLLVAILVNEPDVLKKECFAKVRVSVAEFESKEKEERMRFLIAELGRNLSHKNGIDRFESFLHFFDLSGGLEERYKRLIWQTHHVRNVIVHRGSHADQRLVEACPWLELKVNDPVVVTHEMIHKCGQAVTKYITTIVFRLGKRYGVDMSTANRFDPGLIGPVSS